MTPLGDPHALTMVVKIGGSLTRGGVPRALLSRLASRAGLVMVPGGGTLADRVREIQPAWGLSDRAAHRMAILAMEQMAHALLDLEPRLIAAATPQEIARIAAAGVALWLPATMTLHHDDVPESWNVTSDSLAVWLAGVIGAARLVVVKAPGVVLPPPCGAREADIAAWSRAGVVDAAFATMARRFAGDILLVPADSGDLLDRALDVRALPAAQNESREETQDTPMEGRRA